MYYISRQNTPNLCLSGVGCPCGRRSLCPSSGEDREEGPATEGEGMPWGQCHSPQQTRPPLLLAVSMWAAGPSHFLSHWTSGLSWHPLLLPINGQQQSPQHIGGIRSGMWQQRSWSPVGKAGMGATWSHGWSTLGPLKLSSLAQWRSASEPKKQPHPVVYSMLIPLNNKQDIQLNMVAHWTCLFELAISTLPSPTTHNAHTPTLPWG